MPWRTLPSCNGNLCKPTFCIDKNPPMLGIFYWRFLMVAIVLLVADLFFLLVCAAFIVPVMTAPDYTRTLWRKP